MKYNNNAWRMELDLQSLNINFSPVDCQVGVWTQWSECSATCGNGTETRNRNVTTQTVNEGEKCPDLHENRTCNTNPCPGKMRMKLYKVLFGYVLIQGIVWSN